MLGSQSLSRTAFLPRFALILAFAASVCVHGFAQTVVINELDSDQTGIDAAEFVELYDGGTGNTPLDGLVLVFFNGGNDQSYNPTPFTQAIDLDGRSTDANGYFVVGNAAVPGVDLVFNEGILQNGADAVALYVGNGSDFPSGAAVVTENLIDAVVYDTDDADDPGLLVLLNVGQPQVNENTGGNGDTNSIQRCPNGSGGLRNTSTYIALAPTPSAFNSCGESAPSVLTTTPAGGAIGVALTSNVDITFSEPVTVVGSWFDITCASSGTHMAGVSGGPTTYTLNPDIDFTIGEFCTVTVVAAQVTDQDVDDPPDNMAANHVFSFTTVQGVGAVRAWVASNGVDSNPCTRAAPCRNFGAAVAAVVSGGEVVVLDSAGYGPAVLNKSVTVLAPAGIHGAIAPTAGNALTINAGSTDVVILRGLYLNSQGADTGIEFLAGGALFVESNVIGGFGVSGILFGSEGELFLSDSIVRENGLTGINAQSLSGLAVVQIQRTRVEANGDGVVLGQNARASIRQTVAARNTNSGFRVSQPSGGLTLEKSASIGNATGLWVADGAGTITGGLIGHNTNGMIAEGMGVLYVSNTTITGNGMGLNSLIGGTFISFGNNRLAGNDTDGTFTTTTSQD